MKYKFQHFIDISTSASTMQYIQFNVGGEDVIKRCAHLFNAYKYFKLGKISVKFVPASTLPVDPLGLSFDDSDPNTVDPRDQLNPGLVRITNGEDIFTDLSSLSEQEQISMYEAMLLDPHWYKFSLQGGFKRTAVPLYWQVGQLHQDQYPGATINMPASDAAMSVPGVSTMAIQYNTNVGADTSGSGNDNRFHFISNFSDAHGLFQVGHRGRIGWLPTDAYQRIWNGTTALDIPMVHPVPSIATISCFLPKAYKTLYYYRVYITEEVSFSGLRSIAPESVLSGEAYRIRGADNFLLPPQVIAAVPKTNGPASNPAGYPTATNQINDGSNKS